MQNKISEIRPYLFLAGIHNISVAEFREAKFTHAVNATNYPCEEFKLPDVEFLDINVSDMPEADIKQYFKPVYQFIKDAYEKVLFWF